MLTGADSGRDRLTATAIVGDTLSRRRSVAEVAEETLVRIAAREPELKAFVHVDAGQIRMQAQTLDARPSPGVLQGVTVAVKDQFATRDMPTTYATARYRGVMRGADAACVDLLRGAGALIVGKTTLPEMVSGGEGPATTNPNAPGRTPGGSSSGSAAAVAAGLCAIGVGTQTGGSIIRPASYCGTFGFKPTWNAVTLDGARPVAPSFDTAGFFARCTDDLWLLADLFGLDEAPQSATLPGARIGICKTSSWGVVEPPMREALAEAGRRLAGAGATVEEIALPDRFDPLIEAANAIVTRESRAALMNEVYNSRDLDPSIVDWIGKGARIAPQTIRDAYATADRCRAAIDDILGGHDFVISPSAPGEPPLGLHGTGSSLVNMFWTALHAPVVNVPGLTGPSGAPLGISVVARRFADRTAIAGAGLLAPLLAAGG